MKLNIVINGKHSFPTAIKALVGIKKMKEKLETVRINGEPISMLSLEDHARFEQAEKSHNKRQGF